MTNPPSTTPVIDASVMNGKYLDILSKNLDKCRAYWIRRYDVVLPSDAPLAVRIPFDLFHAGVLRVLKRIMNDNGFRSIALLLLPTPEQLVAEWQRPTVMSLLSRVELFKHVNFIDSVETIEQDDEAKLRHITANSRLLWITPHEVPPAVRARHAVVEAAGVHFDDFVNVEVSAVCVCDFKNKNKQESFSRPALAKKK